jgi:hypothetical protein
MLRGYRLATLAFVILATLTFAGYYLIFQILQLHVTVGQLHESAKLPSGYWMVAPGFSFILSLWVLKLAAIALAVVLTLGYSYCLAWLLTLPKMELQLLRNSSLLKLGIFNTIAWSFELSRLPILGRLTSFKTSALILVRLKPNGYPEFEPLKLKPRTSRLQTQGSNVVRFDRRTH